MTNDGYPEQHELDEIKQWEMRHVFALVDYIACRWHFGDWGVKRYWSKEKWNNKRPVMILELHTGGWSGNEEMVEALLSNFMFRAMWYESWRRGGHYTFEINPYNIGYMTVAEYAKEVGVSKQYIHRRRELYDWLDCGNKKLLVRTKKPNSSTTPERSDATAAQ